MQNIHTFIVDAFTDKPFSGNPAGVCLIKTEIDEKIMQSIASELNLSETAFLLQQKNDTQYNIRYFTPTTEIDFCGHATLASAKIILDKMGKGKVEFITSKNLRISANNNGDYVKMKFPSYKTKDYEPNKAILDAFGIANPVYVGYCQELDMLLIEVNDKQSLLNIKPNFQKALESSKTIKEVVITTKSEDAEYDFYSRCFCPWLGINEDPVTGAAHSVLAKYWGKKLNKRNMSAFQLSKRGGFLHLKIVDEKTLEVFSNAQIVFEGKLNVK
ncbi:MAG: PhzF family phenazine biosynthesis protein [Chitinophagales bacterium]